MTAQEIYDQLMQDAKAARALSRTYVGHLELNTQYDAESRSYEYAARLVKRHLIDPE